MLQTISMGGGSNRKPTAQKQLEGTYRPDRANPKEPTGQAITLSTSCPAHFGSLERETWIRVSAVIDPMRIVTESDIEAFGLLVQALAVQQIASRNVIENGVVVEEISGKGEVKTKANPAWSVMRDAQKLAAYHFSRFGLTPADRSRVSSIGGNSDDEDNWGEFAD